MAAINTLRRGAALAAPRVLQLVPVRHRGKIHVQNPRPGPWERRLFEAITQPFVPEVIKLDSEICAEKRRELDAEKQKLLDHPYELFLLRKCKAKLESVRLIVICQSLPMDQNRLRKIKNLFFNQGLELIFYNNRIMTRAVTGTRLATLTPYFKGQNLYIVGQDSVVAPLMKIIRQTPELVLLGGVVEEYLLSKEGLVAYSQLPSLEQARGQLLSILSTPASRSLGLLSSHQQSLSASLQQHVKQRSHPDSTDS